MTVTLPTENQRWPRFRMLTKEGYNGSTSSGGGWQTEPLENPSENQFGFILHNYSRALLPQLGTALISYRYGLFGDRLYGGSSASNASLREGNTWNSETDGMDLPDLRNKEILIQAAYPNEDGEVSASDWTTVFWGTCEYQLDHPWPAATVPSGEIHYHLIDAFHRTQRWYLNRHSFISGGILASPAKGHPGYNVDPRVPAQLSGNRDPAAGTWDPTGDSSGIYGVHLTHAGAGDIWSDEQVALDVLAIGRPSGEPYWTLSGATDLLSQTEPWEIADNETVFSLITRIFNRGRGRGAALPDWDQPTPTGPITPKLRIFSQLYDNVTYTNPVTAATVTYNGANTNGTSVEVDIIGDHRAVSLQLGDARQYQVDYLEVQGERIETIVTLEHSTTLEKGWSATDQSDFLALDPDERKAAKFHHVYALHRLKRGFRLQTGDGNGGSASNNDYYCDKAGNIVTTTNDNIGISSLGMIELLDDLPFFNGYEISGGAFARSDGQSNEDYDGTPQRMPLKAMMKTGDDLYKWTDAIDQKPQVYLNADGITLAITEDRAGGTRYIGDTDEDDLGSEFNYGDVVLTVAVRSPHRVRKAYGDDNGKRRKIITVKNAHLWLLAPNAIYDLDFENEDSESAPGFRAGGASPTIIRDDRNMIASVAALAVAWYGPIYDLLGNNAVVHRGAQWTLACCGNISSVASYDGGDVVYPTCGQVVKTLRANGQRFELYSPVSSVIYDNTVGHTTWVCDWQDLDMV